MLTIVDFSGGIYWSLFFSLGLCYSESLTGSAGLEATEGLRGLHSSRQWPDCLLKNSAAITQEKTNMGMK